MCMSIRVCSYIVCVHACLYSCMCMHVYSYIGMCVYACVCVRIHVCYIVICACMCV